MFTGIVEHLGKVKRLSRQGTLGKLGLLSDMAGELKMGDSVATNGVCLTVEAIAGDRLDFSISPESLSRTTLGRLRAGDMVNMEPALKFGDRLGGHLIQGHVDGVGTIRHQLHRGQAQEWEILAPANLSRYLVTKGSIAVDGISLTIARCSGSRFWVALIPYTLAHTNLGQRHPGHPVNLEVDVMGKYVEKAVNYNG